MAMFPHESMHQGLAFPQTPCGDCTWSVRLDEGAPAEVVFEAQWDGTTGGQDGMRFEVLDDQGNLLYRSPVETNGPVSISIDGDDIPAGATTLTMLAFFGDHFTPRVNFQVLSVMTLYYGATKAELFQQE